MSCCQSVEHACKKDHAMYGDFRLSFSVRLHNSLLNSTGIAQLFNKGEDSKYHGRQYLTICRDGFDSFAASLFCTSLGLGFENGTSLDYQPFNFYMDMNNFFNVSCDGGATDFGNCSIMRSANDHCATGAAVVRCMPQPELDAGMLAKHGHFV